MTPVTGSHLYQSQLESSSKYLWQALLSVFIVLQRRHVALLDPLQQLVLCLDLAQLMLQVVHLALEIFKAGKLGGLNGPYQGQPQRLGAWIAPWHLLTGAGPLCCKDKDKAWWVGPNYYDYLACKYKSSSKSMSSSIRNNFQVNK